MKTHTEAAFLDWAATRGITLNPAYPLAKSPKFDHGLDLRRFWDVPEGRHGIAGLPTELLFCMRPWQSCFVWRHLGWWPEAPAYENMSHPVEFEVLRGLGVPVGTSDVLEFDESEKGELAAVILMSILFGGHTGDDLVVVPDSARYILQTDHHDAVHVQFRDPKDLDAFVAGMEEENFPLPTDYPDDTFKPQTWLEKRRKALGRRWRSRHPNRSVRGG